MKLSIQQKILFPTLALVLLGAALIATLSYRSGAGAIRQVSETVQRLAADNVAQTLSLWLQGRALEIENLAASEQAAKAVGEGFVAIGARRSLEERLKRTAGTIPAYAALGLINTDGKVLAAGGDASVLSSLVASLERGRLLSRQGMRQHGLTGGVAGPLSLVVAPVVENEQVTGAVLGLVKLTDFASAYLDASRLSAGGRIVVAGDAGALIMDTGESALLETTLTDLGLSERRLKGEGETVAEEMDGQPVILSDAGVADSELRVVVIEQQATMLAPARESGVVSGLTSVVVAGVIAIILVVVVARIVTPIRETASALQSLAAGGGDLTTRLPSKSEDEVGALAASFNRFIASLHQMVQQVRTSSDEVIEVSTALERSASGVQQAVEEQIDQTTMVAAAVNEMASTAQDVARSAQQAADATSQASTHVGEGRVVVEGTTASMQSLATQIETSASGIARLSSAMQNIGSVVDVINGIAEQTNLLALNAAIEAARAGEMGRGFAVVADEVRTLARRTQTSVDEIKSIIDKLQSEAQGVVAGFEMSRERSRQTMDEAARTARSFAVISESIDTVNQMIQQIAAAAEEQSAVAEEVNEKVTGIHHLGERAVEETRLSTGAMVSLQGASDRLSQIVSKFRV